MTAYGPKAHLGSAVINWAPYYIKAMQRRARRHLEGRRQTWWGVKEGAIDLVSISDKVPADAEEEGRDGQGRPEGRQLRDLEGPDRRATTARKCWPRTQSPTTSSCGGINFYVKGVEGKVPGGDKK